jgi:hypothetical protein
MIVPEPLIDDGGPLEILTMESKPAMMLLFIIQISSLTLTLLTVIHDNHAI